MNIHTSPQVVAAGQTIAGLLQNVARLFKPGKKLTLLVRDPDCPDGRRDLVVSDDQLDAAIQALRIRVERDAIDGKVDV